MLVVAEFVRAELVGAELVCARLDTESVSAATTAPYVEVIAGLEVVSGSSSLVSTRGGLLCVTVSMTSLADGIVFEGDGSKSSSPSCRLRRAGITLP